MGVQAVSCIPQAYTHQLRRKTHIIPLTGLNAFFFFAVHTCMSLSERDVVLVVADLCVHRFLRSLVILKGWRNSQVFMAADRGKSQYLVVMQYCIILWCWDMTEEMKEVRNRKIKEFTIPTRPLV